MFGDPGQGTTRFRELVATAPDCFISDSILGLTNVDNPDRHQFRNCHDLLHEFGLRNHVVKCMPCASLAQISCAVLGYLDLIGAGHTDDLQRIRIADNLGVLVIGWALSDLRSYDQDSATYMLSGKLRQDLVRLANMLRYHSKVVWIIGGHGPTCGLHPSFAEVQQEVCALLKGCWPSGLDWRKRGVRS